MSSTPRVSIGPSSYLGWLSAAGALLTCIVQSVQEGQPLLTHGNQTAGIIATVLLVATHAGRQYQAARLPGASAVGGALDALPSDLQEVTAPALEARAQTAAVPDGAAPATAPAQPDAPPQS